MQRFHLVESQFRELFGLIDCGLSRGQLRLDRIARKCQALLLDLIALLAFLFLNLRLLVVEHGDQTVLCQLIVRLALHLRLLVCGVRRGCFRFLIE